MQVLAACLGLLTLASCAASPSASREGPPSGERSNLISVYLGQRSLDEDDYEPVEDQITLGVEYAREVAGDVIGWEIGLMGSTDESEIAGFDVEGATSEFYGGVRKTFGNETVRPYVGGGLSFINSEVEVAGFGSEDDSSVAAYLHGGLGIAVSPSFLIGLDLRALLGSDLTIAGFETDADYVQFALFAGFAF